MGMKKLLCKLMTFVMVCSTIQVPVFAEETQYFCGQEAHAHDQNCYLICEKTLETVEAASGDEIIYHKHEDGCYGAEVTCEKAVHTHAEECEKAPEKAEEDAEKEAPPKMLMLAAETHQEHKTCGALSCTEAHDCEEVQWTAVTAADELVLAATNGDSVYLAADIQLDEELVIAANMNLCLNNHVLQQTAAETRVIKVEEDKIFNLCDCSGESGTKRYWEVDANGLWALKTSGEGDYMTVGGAIIGAKETGVYNDGTFVMSSGEISGCVKGVDNRELFTMSGGAISGCTDYGVYNAKSGTEFTMSGGKISGSEIGVYNYQNAKFAMSGGEISGCAEGLDNYNKSSTFTMSGGKMSGCDIGLNGRSGVLNIAGGEISGCDTGVAVANVEINIAGGVIYNNINHNIYLPSGKKITSIADPLPEGTKIGISVEEMPTESNGYKVTISETGGAEAECDCIISDQGFRKETNTDGHLLFGPRPHTHNVCGDPACEDHEDTIYTMVATEADLIAAAASEGSYYLAADINLSTELKITANMNLCLNGHVLQLVAANRRGIRIGEGKDFNLCDCSEGVTHYWDKDAESGLWTMKANGTSDYKTVGGVITGGGGVYIEEGGSFTMYGGNISGNTMVDTHGGGVYIAGGGSFTMYGGNISGNTMADQYGGGVYIAEGGSFTMEGGSSITGNAARNGGGVYNDSGTFTMRGGSISENAASYGGGVYNNAGTITMENGTISDNTVGGDGKGEVYGGGVYSNKGTITMSNGTISGNAAAGAKGYGGGVYCYQGAITMSDGTITKNTAKNTGGGVYNNMGTITMENGTISGNTGNYGGGVYNNKGTITMENGTISGNTGNYGGGVWNNYTITLKGGSISGNTASKDGGGVYNNAGTFTMTDDGIISDNTALEYGGGVYNVSGTFTMRGGSISGNKAGSKGGGVYNYDKNVTITLNGGSISGNIIDGSTTASNVYLARDQKITVGESMTEGASFGITVANAKPYTFTKEAVTDDAIKACFFSDDASYGIKKDADGKLQMRESHDHGICGATSCEHTDCMKEWTSVSTTADLIAAAAREGSYYLAADIYLSTELKITANMNLCLNDHVLQQTTAETRVLSVSRGVNFNLCDCKGTNGTTRCWDVAENGLWTLETSGESGNTTVGGVITGGETKKESEYDSEKNGGAVYNYGSFTMYGGNISGNTAGFGSGVWNESTFTMEGGNISGNVATSSGGGVYNYENCAFTMNRGSISGNTAQWGGGVFSESTFTVYGGSISGNVATSSGGGVYNNDNGIFTMEDGSSISDNKSTNAKGYGGGVYSKGTFTMNGGTISGNGLDGEKGYGGGVWKQSGTFIMNGGKISGNTAPNCGGGVYNKTGDFTMNDGEISGNKAGSGGGVWNESTFTMEGGNISGNEVTGSGGGVYNKTGTFTMNDGTISDNKLTGENGYGGGVYNEVTFTMNGGTISGTKFTGTKKSYGGGVYNYNTGTFTMEGGSITGNDVSTNGGGVCNFGAFTMEKGSITNNTAQTNGGAVWNGEGSTFTMKDGSIDNNKTRSSGGGGVYNYGAFTMEKGSITNNTAQTYGGGVYNNNTGTFNMESGSISGNTASNYGGGVYNTSGIFTMEDGSSISSNKAATGGGVYNAAGTFTMRGGNIDNNRENVRNGGGVYNTGAFTMEDGSISGNTASTNGGGVYNNGDFTMEGGSITGNDVSTNGGGLYVYSGTITLNGGSITGNTKTDTDTAIATNNNIYLNTNKLITVGETMAQSASFGITAANAKPYTFTTAAVENNDIMACFSPDDANCFVKKAADGKLQLLERHVHSICGSAECGDENSHTDCTEPEEWKAVSTETELSAAEAAGGYVYLVEDIKLSAALEISGAVNLCLNGKKLCLDEGMTSSVIIVKEGATLNLCDCSGTNAGTITGGNAPQDGGGVHNKGTFTIYGGSISGNMAANAGGGVYNEGTFTMNGGNISRNTRTDGTTSNVCQGTGGKIFVGTTMAEGANFGITATESVPFTTNAVSDAAMECFFSDNLSYEISKDADGMLQLVARETHIHFLCGSAECADETHTDCDEITWTPINTEAGLIDAAKNGDSVYLAADIELGAALEISGALNLCLNGHKLSLESNVQDSVIHVAEGATLNLCDCSDTDAGTITGGNAATRNGGGVLNKGTFTMYSGSIGANKAKNGGGVYNDSTGTFNMEGGNISGNEVTVSGGGVYNTSTGTFNMESGSISGNTASSSGGGVFNNSNGTFNMEGGSISGNTASNYGGGVLNKGTFNVKSGSISGNTAKKEGGGVSNEGNSFTMTGGTITGNKCDKGGGVSQYTGSFTLSGGTITGNTKLDEVTVNNVYLQNNKLLTVGETMAEGASFGITAVNAKPYTFTTNIVEDNTIMASFFSDDANYIIGKDGEGKLQLEEGFTVTVNATLGSDPSDEMFANGMVLKLKNEAYEGDLTKSEAGVYQLAVKQGTYTLQYGTGDEWTVITESLEVTGDTTVDQTWYQVEFGDSKTFEPAGKEIKIEVPAAPEKEGYKFLGWNFNGTLYQPGEEITATLNDHVKATAEFTDKFTVTVNATLGSDPSDEMFADGMVLKLKNEAYEGDLTKSEAGVYQLAVKQGTYTLQYGTGDEWTVITDSLEVTDDTTVDQTWYQVEFGDSKTFEPAGKAIKIVVPAAPEKEGYKFLGWNFNGTLYQPGDEITITLDSHIQATAEFTDDFTVTVNTKLGADLSDEMFADGMVLKLTKDAYEAELTKDTTGVYQFVVKQGTYTLQYGTGDEWTVITESLEVTGDKTVDQTWYQVEFGESKTYELAGKEIEIVVPAAPEKEGYEFLGWNFNGTLYQPGDVITVTLDSHIQATAEFTEEEGGDKPGGDTPGTDKPVTPPSGGSSSGGGGGGGGGTPAVNVVVSKAENGKVMVDTTNAKKDSVVTITVTPDAGYAVGTIKVIDSDGKEVKVTENGDGKYTFIKPSKKVTISVDFIKAEAAKADKITLENVDKAKALVLTINRKEADVFGKEVVNDVAPIIRQERTMLPIRIVVEALGGKIAWNAAERKVSITKGEQLIEIVINNSIAYVNGKAVQLDAPAFIEGGRTYLPLRFVAENLNANVLWDAKTKQIIIVPKAEPAAIAAEAAESKTAEDKKQM